MFAVAVAVFCCGLKMFWFFFSLFDFSDDTNYHVFTTRARAHTQTNNLFQFASFVAGLFVDLFVLVLLFSFVDLILFNTMYFFSLQVSRLHCLFFLLYLKLRTKFALAIKRSKWRNRKKTENFYRPIDRSQQIGSKSIGHRQHVTQLPKEQKLTDRKKRKKKWARKTSSLNS